MPELENLIGDKKKIENKIINVLKAIFDPEIPVNIVDLQIK